MAYIHPSFRPYVVLALLCLGGLPPAAASSEPCPNPAIVEVPPPSGSPPNTPPTLRVVTPWTFGAGTDGPDVQIVRKNGTTWGNQPWYSKLESGLAAATAQWNGCSQPPGCDNAPDFSLNLADQSNGNMEKLAIHYLPNTKPPKEDGRRVIGRHRVVTNTGVPVNLLILYGKCFSGSFIPCIGPMGQKRLDFNSPQGRKVLIHELGHVAGLGHDSAQGGGCSGNGLMQKSLNGGEDWSDKYCVWANALNCNPQGSPAGKCHYPGGSFAVSGMVTGLEHVTHASIKMTSERDGADFPARSIPVGGGGPQSFSFSSVPDGAAFTVSVEADQTDCPQRSGTVSGGPVSVPTINCRPCGSSAQAGGSTGPCPQEPIYIGPFEPFMPQHLDVGLCENHWAFCNGLIPWFIAQGGPNCPTECDESFTCVDMMINNVLVEHCEVTATCSSNCAGAAPMELVGPTLGLVEPAPNTIAWTELPVAGTAESSAGLRGFLFYVDHQLVEPLEMVIEGGGNQLSFSGVLDTSGFSAGEHDLQVVAVDGAGNSMASFVERRFLSTAGPGEPDIEIRLDWNGASIPDGSSYTFGESPAPGGFTNRKFRIRNTGGEMLELSNPADLVSGECFEQSTTPGAVLSPGQTRHFIVRLSCPAVGSYEGQVEILSNDPDTEAAYTFTVLGSVVDGGTAGDPAEPPSSPGACAGLVQEAEHGSLNGFEIVGDPSASGGEYIRVPNGAGDASSPSSSFRASFCFSVPTSGLYRIKSRVRAPTFEDDSFFVQVDGAPAGGYLWAAQVGPGFEQDYLNDWSVEDPVEIFLGAGDHAVDIYLREDGSGLDRLELELSDEALPCGPLTQEAEAGELTGFSVVPDPAASGGQAIVVPNGAGDRLSPDEGFKASYCFTVPTAGTYRIVGREKAPSFSDDSFWVRLDDQPAGDDAYLWSAQVGSSYRDDEVNDVNVEDPVERVLGAGFHTVDIYQREDGAHLDTIRLERQADPPCGPLVQEAEAGELTGFSVVSDPAASGGQAIEVPEGSGDASSPQPGFVASYCFGVETPGNYRIAARTHAPDHGADSFWARVDGSPGDAYFWVLEVGAGYRDELVGDHGGEDPVEVFLSVGNHVVEIYLREDGSRLDRIELQRQ